jgi:hypothetical protein
MSAWCGYYEQDGSKHEVFVDTMSIDGGIVQGSGVDEVGAFTMRGKAVSQHISFVKQYIGQHAVHYDGALKDDLDGQVIVGNWRIKSQCGRFRMYRSLWCGCYVQNRRREAMHFESFTTKGNTIQGQGLDTVGDFTVYGHISGNEVSFAKHYTGQHDVHYRGALHIGRSALTQSGCARVISGTWHIGSMSDSFRLECVCGESVLEVAKGAPQSFASLDSDEDFYSILGFVRYQTIDPRELQQAGRIASMKWHPDKHMRDPQWYQDACKGVMQMINVAKDTLGNPGAKSRYDEFLKLKRGEKRPQVKACAAPKTDPPSFWGKAFRWACNIGLTAVGVAAVVTSVLCPPASALGVCALGAFGGAAVGGGVAGTFSSLTGPEKSWAEWGKDVGVAAIIGGVSGGMLGGAGHATSAMVKAGEMTTRGAVGAMGVAGGAAGVTGQAIKDGVDLCDGTQTLRQLRWDNYGRSALVGFVAGSASKYFSNQADKLCPAGKAIADGTIDATEELAVNAGLNRAVGKFLADMGGTAFGDATDAELLAIGGRDPSLCDKAQKLGLKGIPKGAKAIIIVLGGR